MPIFYEEKCLILLDSMSKTGERRIEEIQKSIIDIYSEYFTHKHRIFDRQVCLRNNKSKPSLKKHNLSFFVLKSLFFSIFLRSAFSFRVNLFGIDCCMFFLFLITITITIATETITATGIATIIPFSRFC